MGQTWEQEEKCAIDGLKQDDRYFQRRRTQGTGCASQNSRRESEIFKRRERVKRRDQCALMK